MTKPGRIVFIGVMLTVLFAGVAAFGAEYFVSAERGDNQNAGTQAAPFKNIEAALKAAKAGDTIRVARGNYFGLRGKGYLEIGEPVELLGGYAPDFSSRDIVRFPTLIQPGRKSAESGRKPLVSILNVPVGATFVMDGFVLDRGEQNAYSPKEGFIAGLGGRILRSTERPADGPSTVEEPLICFTNKVRARIEGDIVIRNCFLLNGHFAIQGGFKHGTVRILDNVFAANKMAAVEVFGTGGKKGPKGPQAKDGHVEIARNAVLFTWSRLKDFADMGCAVRVMTMVSYDIHDNLIVGSVLAGIDHTRGNPNDWVKIDGNVFFLNKQAPLLYVEPGTSAAGKMERVRIEDLNADLGLASCRGNTGKIDFKPPLNKDYLEGFLNARYSETADFDPDSPANVLREIVGLPKQGKLVTRVSMFANRYPLQDAMKLFGLPAKAGGRAAK
ncbi:MAG: DUF1565 domain-containing protein [Candidatus Aminicenantes bacterium]|nr:DUF1565 domain-containing protein [Candidatus Aminicenantes bacterium]